MKNCTINRIISNNKIHAVFKFLSTVWEINLKMFGCCKRMLHTSLSKSEHFFKNILFLAYSGDHAVKETERMIQSIYASTI